MLSRGVRLPVWVRWTVLALTGALVSGQLGCGRNPAQVRWDRAWSTVEASKTNQETQADAFLKLGRQARRPEDEGAAMLEAGRSLRAADPVRAAQIFQKLATAGPRRVDRARGHYELARMAEDAGHLLAAIRIYREIILTYPEDMPGERSLAHLLRMARMRGDVAVDRHLAWTHRIAPLLANTSLADDLLDQAADEARLRFLRGGSDSARWWHLAVALYSRLIDTMPRAGRWDDALWERSWLWHAGGRFPEEVADLERLIRTRPNVSFIGQNEHPYFWKSELRKARLLEYELADPRAAAAAYLRYAAEHPQSLRRDDVLFFAACAERRAGDVQAAARVEARLIAEHPESRFVRHLPANPRAQACVAPEWTR